MGEPLGRSPRQVTIADHLWEAFDLMSRDMGVDRDGLVNQALFAFARQHSYLSPRPSGEPSSMPPGDQAARGPNSFSHDPASFGRVAPIPVPVVPAPNPFAGNPPASAPPRTAPIPVPAALVIPAPVVPAVSLPPSSPIPAPAVFDSLSELRLDLPSRPASQPPPLSAPPARDSQPASDFGSALEENDSAGAPPTSEGAAASEAVLVLYAEGRELDRVVGQRFLIGRGKHCDLIINSGKVSREHAVIIREGSDFYIEDLGSSNGTWFDKKRITRRQIGDGDEYFVCSEKLTCRLS